MIVCVTPNPTMDRTYVVPGYGEGGVFRVQTQHVGPGGKGINVARAVSGLGGLGVCAGFLAGHTGRHIMEMLDSEGIHQHWTLLDEGETRTCPVLADLERQHTTVINELGPTALPEDWARLQRDILDAAADSEFVCFGGSLPPGAPSSVFGDLLALLRDAGKIVWVDTSGPGLAAALEQKGCGIKVNQAEIGAILERTVATPQAAAEAATHLSQRLDAPVVVTMGAAGAVLSMHGEVWRATPPEIRIVSDVGSGDSFFAGLLVGFLRGHTPVKALRQAVAAGAANALSMGGGRFTWDQFEDMMARTQVESLG
ncbi:MAG: hexose kinase [Anaerolineae bacterium]|nr:hexose kinase [Anaerolineae bacterium]